MKKRMFAWTALLVVVGAAAMAQAPPAKPPARAVQAERARAVEQMLVDLEQRAWREEKNRNAEFFREVMVEEFLAVESDGKRYTKAEALALIPTVQVSSFALTDLKVLRLGRDAALITYRAVVTGPGEGREVTREFLASTAWVRRGTKWGMAFHQKTAVPQ